MATSKLSEIASGGATAGATDTVVAVRSGTTDVLVTPVALDTAQTWTAAQTVKVTDSATATVTNCLIVSHDSSGTPATSFGTGILFQGQDTTTADQNIAAIQGVWTTATHASAASKLNFQTRTGAGALTTNLTLDGAGVLTLNNGSVTAPTLVWAAQPTWGLYYKDSASAWFFTAAGADRVLISSSPRIRSDSQWTWALDTSATMSAADTGFARSAAGIVKVTNGSSSLGSLLVGQITTSTLGLTVQGIASRTVGLLQLQTSAGASLGNVGGCIFDHFADGGSTHTDGTEDTLYTDTTVANTLAINGDTIEAWYEVQVVLSATATRRIQIYFAGVKIYDSGTLTFAATGTCTFSVMITRATSTTCRATVTPLFTGSATILGFDASAYTPEGTLTGLTLTGTSIIKLTAIAAGTGAASGDVTANQGKIWLWPAA